MKPIFINDEHEFSKVPEDVEFLILQNLPGCAFFKEQPHRGYGKFGTMSSTKYNTAFIQKFDLLKKLKILVMIGMTPNHPLQIKQKLTKYFGFDEKASYSNSLFQSKQIFTVNQQFSIISKLHCDQYLIHETNLAFVSDKSFSKKVKFVRIMDELEQLDQGQQIIQKVAEFYKMPLSVLNEMDQLEKTEAITRVQQLRGYKLSELYKKFCEVHSVSEIEFCDLLYETGRKPSQRRNHFRGEDVDKNIQLISQLDLSQQMYLDFIVTKNNHVGFVQVFKQKLPEIFAAYIMDPRIGVQAKAETVKRLFFVDGFLSDSALVAILRQKLEDQKTIFDQLQKFCEEMVLEQRHTKFVLCAGGGFTHAGKVSYAGLMLDLARQAVRSDPGLLSKLVEQNPFQLSELQAVSLICSCPGHIPFLKKLKREKVVALVFQTDLSTKQKFEVLKDLGVSCKEMLDELLIEEDLEANSRAIVYLHAVLLVEMKEQLDILERRVGEGRDKVGVLGKSLNGKMTV